jgi:hypothetical protein
MLATKRVSDLSSQRRWSGGPWPSIRGIDAENLWKPRPLQSVFPTGTGRWGRPSRDTENRFQDQADDQCLVINDIPTLPDVTCPTGGHPHLECRPGRSWLPTGHQNTLITINIRINFFPPDPKIHLEHRRGEVGLGGAREARVERKPRGENGHARDVLVHGQRREDGRGAALREAADHDP